MTDDAGRPVDRAINRALAEIQLTAFAWVTNREAIPGLKADIARELGKLYRNTAFLDAIQRATGDRKRTMRRLGMFCEALESAGLDLEHSVTYEPAE